MTRDEIISGLEREVKNIRMKPKGKMLGICMTADEAEDIIVLLKEQEGHVSVPFSWLVKFCTHIDFVEPLTDSEREVAWRQKLRQQFGINASKKAVKWKGDDSN